uniref:Fibrinogen-related protein n=1 Tax=Littorina littorea TaxID=31216 RepID=A0A0A7RW16_LITLI|nr:fibrinogen-related protein [Littorina littorea]
MSMQAWSLSVLLVAVCCSVVVVAEVELVPGTRPLNSLDPVQYKDCGHLHKAGYNVSGQHVLYMNKTTPFLIRCEFTKDNAFNVIQRRIDGSVNFAAPLASYVSGFGSVQGDYWGGLNAINYLTMQQGNRVLTIQMQDWSGTNQNVRYQDFRVLPQDNRYQMFVSGYSGTLPDDFSYHNGMTFQTYDYPDQNKCAVNMGAGWWYNYCAYVLLNGHYYNGGHYTPTSGFYDGIYYKDWNGYGYSLKFVSMVVSST